MRTEPIILRRNGLATCRVCGMSHSEPGTLCDRCTSILTEYRDQHAAEARFWARYIVGCSVLLALGIVAVVALLVIAR